MRELFKTLSLLGQGSEETKMSKMTNDTRCMSLVPGAGVALVEGLQIDAGALRLPW
ncbi:hypothetical protein P171DRAFT_427488 [Karstenula rhodostoma CBS 690.94]|uniref:Uncharacterized protein n=1 Tax=Karstenula rhodostoma CBS 690.94 TaxID=1392251 RepID=A0A9P4UH67_9PLEO|nr:hypothetical protein P171DRAFT_427488 [Karstenula rhodostoma CBS 690.94]